MRPISDKEWQELPSKKNLFTVRNAALINLNTGEPVRHYSANTKIVVSQKYVSSGKTYYRTESSARQKLNWAFEASAFGPLNEEAPSAHSTIPNKTEGESLTPLKNKKTKDGGQCDLSEDGEKVRARSFWAKLFRK